MEAQELGGMSVGPEEFGCGWSAKHESSGVEKGYTKKLFWNPQSFADHLKTLGLCLPGEEYCISQDS